MGKSNFGFLIGLIMIINILVLGIVYILPGMKEIMLFGHCAGTIILIYAIVGSIIYLINIFKLPRRRKSRKNRV